MALPLTRQPPWWQNQQNVGTIEAIKQQQVMDRERLDFQRQRWGEVLSMYRDAFGDAGTDGGFSVPSEFSQAVNLYQPGGQFGAGGRAEVHQAGQQALAAGQIGLASTGMSSGTNVAGLKARVLADVGLAKKKISDERVGLLGGALTQAGAAGLSARQIAAQREANLMRTLSSFGRV